MKLLTTSIAALVLAAAAACGGPEAPASPEVPANSAPSDAPDGLPDGAIRVTDSAEKAYWAVPREDGRVTLYEFMEDGQAGATSSTLEGLKAIYPDIDFTEVEAALAAQLSP